MSWNRLCRGLAYFTLIFFLGLWLGGCIELTQKTKIENDGRCSEIIQITTNAMFAEGLKNEMKTGDIEKKGYRVETKTDGDKVHIFFVRDFKNVPEMYKAQRFDPMSGMEDKGSSPRPEVKGELKIQDLIFVKTMSFKETTPSKAEVTGKSQSPEDKKMDEMGKQFAQNLFTYKRVVQMPGEIISANTKEIDKATNTATWSVPFDELQKGCVFEVKSRSINIPAIVGAAVGLLVVIILILVALTRKKPESPAGPEARPEGSQAS